jgi:cell wall-associated NlpC family hydrolase
VLGIIAAVCAIGCAVVLGVAKGEPKVTSVEPGPVLASESADRVPTDKIQYDAPSREQKAAARSALEIAEHKEQQADIELGPGGIPPASAGDNGTFDEAPGRSHGIATETMTGVDGLPPERSAFLLGRTAIAPPGAPAEVERTISAANAIVGLPYIWGGGHGSWNDNGYDCSGAVSYALGGGGLLGAPLDSSGLMDWGEPGPGKWITVYANPSHTYAVIAGLRWDTSGTQSGTGPKWYAESSYPKGFVVRHPPGL